MPDKREMFNAMMDFYRRNMSSIPQVERTPFIAQVEVQHLGGVQPRRRREVTGEFAPSDSPKRDPIRIDEVDPNLGPISGGTNVIIYGVHLDMNTVVDARNPRNNNHSIWQNVSADAGGNFIICTTRSRFGALEILVAWDLVVTDPQGKVLLYTWMDVCRGFGHKF